jgi:anthranilate phosphoribosyltransferase
VERREVTPADFGVPTAKGQDLKGGDPARNAEIARSVLQGRGGAARDIVLVNASAALVAAGKAKDFAGGVRLAKESIDSGAAFEKLRRLAEFSPGG